MTKRQTKKNTKTGTKKGVKKNVKKNVTKTTRVRKKGLVDSSPLSNSSNIDSNSCSDRFSEIAEFYETIEKSYDELLEKGPFSLDLDVLEISLTAQMRQIRKIRKGFRQARRQDIHASFYKYALRAYWKFLNLTERGFRVIRSLFFTFKKYICFWRK